MTCRWPVWLAFIVGLLAVIPAAGAVEREPTGRAAATAQPLLLYSAVTDRGADGELRTVETMRADGTRRRRLATGSAPAWSPDGKRIAYRTSDRVFVMNADGAAKVTIGRAAGIDDVPTWSSTGRLLAFTAESPSGERTLVVAAAVGRTAVEVIGNGLHPAWSPDGSSLAYVARSGSFAASRLVVRRADGASATAVVASDDAIETPAWSPDGTQIAYVLRPWNPNHLPTLWIVPSAGGEPRRLGDVAAEAPRWAPDGSTILFRRGGVGSCGYKIGCAADGRPCSDCEQVTSVYAIRRDGTFQRRLTRGVDHSPQWSADGTRIAFIRYFEHPERGLISAIYHARPGGACPTAIVLGSEMRRFSAPASWQPRAGARPPALHCSDVSVTGTITGRSTLGGAVRLSFAVRNRGDRPARNVRLRLDLSRFFVFTRHAGCVSRSTAAGGLRAFDCGLATVAAGRTKRVELQGVLDPKGDAFFPGYVQRSSRGVEAFAAVRVPGDSDPSDDRLRLVHRVVPCTLEGTSGNDEIRGGAGRDLICAREGDDLVRSGAGSDVVDGGVGADDLDPGTGRDVVVGRGGDDVVSVVDGESDVVLCGTGLDRVLADRKDDVNPSCERVERR